MKHSRDDRSGMSSKLADGELTPEQVARLNNDRMALEEELKSHLHAIGQITELWEGQKERFAELDVSIDKLQMDLGISNKRIQEAQKRIDGLSSQKGIDAADASRIKELDKQLASHNAEIEKFKQKTTAFETEIEALQEKILEIGGLELRTQRSKVTGIKEDMIDLSNGRTTNAEVAKLKAEKDISKLEASIEQNEGALETLDEELSEVRDKIKTKDAAIAEVKAKVDEAQDELETKQDKRDEIKANLDENSESVNAFRSLEMEMKQKIDDHERSFTDNEKKLKHWVDKLGSLSLHKIDDGEEEDDAEGSEKGDADTSKGESSVKAGKRKTADDDASDAEKPSLELQQFPEDELRGIDKDALKEEIVVFEEKVQKGGANMSVLQEYRKRQTEFLARAKDLEKTTSQRESAKQKHDDLRKQRLKQFMAGFSTISSKVKEMYQTIALGGNAELELVDSLDPFSEGIIFSVMPPKKSWENISNLSGGEKTLSSLALVFALDEIDAALDFRNVSIVANITARRYLQDEQLHKELPDFTDILSGTGLPGVTDNIPTAVPSVTLPGGVLPTTGLPGVTDEEAKLEQIRENLKDKTSDFSTAIEQKQKEMQPWMTKIADKVAARDVAQQERDLLADREDEAKAERDAALRAKEELLAEIEDKKQKSDGLIKDRGSFQRKAADHDADIREMHAKEAQIRS
ncbi:hypothetical protein A4X13_0g8694, partial [Tilletia indica]